MVSQIVGMYMGTSAEHRLFCRLFLLAWMEQADSKDRGKQVELLGYKSDC